jgi:prevent-host-death family protein
MKGVSLMAQLSIAQAKSHFSDVIRLVESGEEVTVTRGPKKEPVATIIPVKPHPDRPERKLGTLEGRMTVIFHDDWYMTDEELLAS